jgi:hypothetical protein
MSVVAVPYGYNEGQDPRQLPAHGMVDTMAELPSLLGLVAMRGMANPAAPAGAGAVSP